MGPNDLTAVAHVSNRRSHHAARESGSDGAKSALPERLRCADVAENRARRYAKRHRISKPFWPLLATVILMGLVLERWRILLSLRSGKGVAGDGNIMPRRVSSMTLENKQCDPVAQPLTRDTSRTIDDDPQPKYRPPAYFLARDVAQMIAFLMRNRGRQDNSVVQAKWKVVDDFSLPLAIYLREIEASAAWRKLVAEMSAVILAPTVRLPDGMPRSLRHQQIMALLPEWQRRGEALLSIIDGSGGGGDPTPNAVPDEGDAPGDDDNPPAP